MTSRELNQDLNTAKRASLSGPVFIKDERQVTHVFLSIDSYRTLTNSQCNIVDLLAITDSTDPEFTPHKIHSLTKPFRL